MNVIKEPAVCSGGSLKQTADKNYIHHTTYRKAIPLSSWKMFIGCVFREEAIEVESVSFTQKACIIFCTRYIYDQTEDDPSRSKR